MTKGKRRELSIGEEVEVCWTWERKKYSALAVVEAINSNSVRVSLRYDVPVTEGRYYPKGRIFRFNRADVHPVPGRSDRARALQVAAFTEGLTLRQSNHMVEAVARAFDDTPQKTITWIATVAYSSGRTVDEELWGYYETWAGYRKEIKAA